jgi:hypothetical protein
MQANGAQLRELAALYDAGHLRPVIDKTFPFDQTLEALACVEQGRANGKVVITRLTTAPCRPTPSGSARSHSLSPTLSRTPPT